MLGRIAYLTFIFKETSQFPALWANQNFFTASSPLLPQDLGRRADGIGPCPGRLHSPSKGLPLRKDEGLASCSSSPHTLCDPQNGCCNHMCSLCYVLPVWGSLPGFSLAARQASKCCGCSLVPTSPPTQGGRDRGGVLLRGERPKKGTLRDAEGKAPCHTSAPGLPVNLALLLWVL